MVMQFPEFDFDCSEADATPRQAAGSVALRLSEYMKAVASMSKFYSRFSPVFEDIGRQWVKANYRESRQAMRRRPVR